MFVDYGKRIYLPLETCALGVTGEDIAQRRATNSLLP